MILLGPSPNYELDLPQETPMTVRKLRELEIDVFALPVHPAADVFPMLDDEELRELADDIIANGLREPIVVQEIDGQLTLVDGRNRREACRLADVKPELYYLPPDTDPVAFIYSTNVTRRHLTQGQKAMAVARMYPDPELGGRGRKSLLSKEFSSARLSQARSVVIYAPDLADSVLLGAVPLNDAYKEAQARKKAAETYEERFAALHASDPELAETVKEERLSLAEAEGIVRKRKADDAERARIRRDMLARSFADLVSGGVMFSFLEAAEDVISVLSDPEVQPEIKKYFPRGPGAEVADLRKARAGLDQLIKVAKGFKEPTHA